MQQQLKINFISGLPRSGSTLLAAILRQNPRFHAAAQSPVAELFMSLQKSMSGASDSSVFISDVQREMILKSCVETYYKYSEPPKVVVFDNNRSWCTLLSAVVRLFPATRVVCCLRKPAWILDSIERQVQRNALQPSKVFNYEPGGNVYIRTDHLMKNNFVGPSLSALKQAWFGEHADRLIAIRYESLTAHPVDVMDQLYDLLCEEHYAHNFDNVEYNASEFDTRLGLPDFHRVSPKVQVNERETILPLDLFKQYDNAFWDLPGQNPRGVKIL